MESKQQRPKRRDAAQRRLRRRRLFITAAISSVPPENYAPNDAAALALGSMNEAKWAYKQAKRRELVRSQSEETRGDAFVKDSSTPIRIARPNRVLSRLNRSPTFPPLVPEEVKIESVFLNEILGMLRSYAGNIPSHQLLDALATASGISWENCAEILLGYELVAHPIPPGHIRATRAARAFRNRYRDGRTRYSTWSVDTGPGRLEGDWAYFDEEDLEALPPEIIIPKRLKRRDYLTNYVIESDGAVLDVYGAAKLRPLFRHPFPQKFSPLVLGALLRNVIP